MRSFCTVMTSTVFALVLAACAGGSGYAPSPPPEIEIRTGVVEQVNLTQIKSNHDAGLGAILGGIGGAGIGSLIGAGTGRDVAIAAGAIAGAIGGNMAQQKYFDQPQAAQQVYVRLSSGVLVMITQPVNPDVYAGRKVYVDGTGIDARVLPR